jgi:hypothetical protein
LQIDGGGAPVGLAAPRAALSDSPACPGVGGKAAQAGINRKAGPMEAEIEKIGILANPMVASRAATT